METVSKLKLPEDWRRRTRVFVARKKPRGVVAPIISAETYEEDRRRNNSRPDLSPRPGWPRVRPT